jgi:hypothetical protein
MDGGGQIGTGKAAAGQSGALVATRTVSPATSAQEQDHHDRQRREGDEGEYLHPPRRASARRVVRLHVPLLLRGALGAARSLPSKAAVRRLLEVTLAGLGPAKVGSVAGS